MLFIAWTFRKKRYLVILGNLPRLRGSSSNKNGHQLYRDPRSSSESSSWSARIAEQNCRSAASEASWKHTGATRRDQLGAGISQETSEFFSRREFR